MGAEDAWEVARFSVCCGSGHDGENTRGSRGGFRRLWYSTKNSLQSFEDSLWFEYIDFLFINVLTLEVISIARVGSLRPERWALDARTLRSGRI